MNFPIHLCQPDETKSCAACCGIYNFLSNGRDHVALRLQRNRRALQNLTPGKDDVIKSHSLRYRVQDNGEGKLFQSIFNCEFVGFLDEHCRRVGCLIHPERLGGEDLRHYSFYGQNLCRDHFCLSYYYLSLQEQRLVVTTIRDWYLYGLIITDIDLVKAVFRILSDAAGEALDVFLVAESPELSSILLRLWQYKLDWPYRMQGVARLGKYIFKGDEYREVRIPYGRYHRKVSNFDGLFVAYGSKFGSGRDIDDAEGLISRIVDDFARGYGRRKAGSHGFTA
ncbi:hypothetical protein [Thermodesulforhabdus norvegica]|uniref:Uncharacterized protein n=1 Tax=Thermodesulforhabdus norvegica TaxID=39841 RepID=A0A1I4TXA9_9BACT|nr:hypothetical protein [Thermodesulforhabdus norvegica]SFM81372.1 hypothetical protein SAMN05660836_01577 [Thermodesulforhabdus norvegica]